MKISAPITTAIAAALAGAGLLSAPLAGADTSLGEPGRLVNGDVVQAWTISNLRVSSDTLPYQVDGTLWEATATDEAIQGSVIPIVSNLNAVASDGEYYRVLYGVATPQGVSPAALSQGEKTTGKIYFDVTGAAPDSVVYNDGNENLLVWTAPAPVVSHTAGGSGGGQQVATKPGATNPLSTSSPTSAAPGAPAAPATAGSHGTPLPAEQVGSSGTPAAGAPAPAAGTPAPATVAPATPSQGTPLSPDDQVPASTPAPATPAPAAPAPAAPAAPAPVAGTPVAGAPAPAIPAAATPAPAVGSPAPIQGSALLHAAN